MYEFWRPVFGFEHYYWISSLGRVYSVRSDRILRQIVHSNGYHMQTFVISGIRYNRMISGLVLEAFVGPRPPENEARHINGRRGENWLGNLEWGTASENYQDRHRHGTANDGERGGLAKLTNEKVREIRRRYRPRVVTQAALAAEYGVNQTKISAIVNRKTWKHI